MNRLKQWALGQVAGRILRNTAAGKYGPLAQRVYQNLAGIKTGVGVVLAFVAVVLEGAIQTGFCAWLVSLGATWVDCGGWVETVAHSTAAISAFWLWLGTVDGALRLDPPVPTGAPPDDGRSSG